QLRPLSQRSYSRPMVEPRSDQPGQATESGRRCGILVPPFHRERVLLDGPLGLWSEYPLALRGGDGRDRQELRDQTRRRETNQNGFSPGSEQSPGLHLRKIPVTLGLRFRRVNRCANV